MISQIRVTAHGFQRRFEECCHLRAAGIGEQHRHTIDQRIQRIDSFRVPGMKQPGGIEIAQRAVYVTDVEVRITLCEALGEGLLRLHWQLRKGDLGARRRERLIQPATRHQNQ